jgi:ubiquinone/menaquinone biosynthesis C-methylase UbiE
MKLTLVPPPPLCTLLRLCEASPLPKKILDCGAGGAAPPLSVFADYGYICSGIDISPQRVDLARRFADDTDLPMDLRAGDMRCLPYADNSFSFVYSFNTIFHMSKVDIAQALLEMGRVLADEGILYVNVLSIEDEEYGKGAELAAGEFHQEEDGAQVIHSYFRDDEADTLFDGCEIMMKVKRNITAYRSGKPEQMAYLDYYVRKGP